MKNRSLYIVDLKKADKTFNRLIGGKGANLAELYTIKALNVPDGFCITTEAFKETVGNDQEFNSLQEQLALLTENQRNEINEMSKKIRTLIESIALSQELKSQIVARMDQYGGDYAYAVRSSATAEDLATASFAGQQDTYLNVIGETAILKHISKCWASLFTERAIIYRLQNGFDHRKVYLAVIIQQMVVAKVAGVLFTAHPVTGNRKVSSIDASFGLGEALVSGLVNADNYQVRASRIIEKKISEKRIAIEIIKNGGTEQKEIGPEQQHKQALTDEQILQLEQTGRMIEAHFGHSQDIEWCLSDNKFYVVQSRPITTLYPVPAADDLENRVYVSVGHQQMMTDAFKPLGISVWMLTGNRAIFKMAGGRLFVDISKGLASPAGRENLLNVLGHSDPLIKDALMTVIDRNFIKEGPEANIPGQVKGHHGMSAADILAEAGADTGIVADLISSSERSVSALKDNIRIKTGPDVFAYILNDMEQRRQLSLEKKNLNVIMAAIHASAWINDKMKEWLGEINAADVLSLSVPNNITSEMGLELLDLADVIRPYPEVVAYLQGAKQDNLLNGLCQLEAGWQVRDAINAYLNKYGMRCAGEIDITRARWRENPGALVPMILSNIKNLEPGESTRRFKQGKQAALEKEQDLMLRLKQLPYGEEKARETKQMIDLLRNFIGYREYPKYDIVSRYFIYKQGLLQEAERLVKAGVLRDEKDSYYLYFEELQEVVRTGKVDYQLIDQRKTDYQFYEKLTPPRVITSEGEVITGHYSRENIPVGALAGLAVSSGIVEGRARVVLNVEGADLEDGDILVTTFTDPSWTPLFLAIKGLVTEVGGLMTHGAVIAREYGLPAVVGVENATKLIKDGQRIRVHGTAGYVEIMSEVEV
ncbi:phosphoenolpyruvate synthase [Mucilaginibacter gossypii]|uniref:phosphoenolpyruvate synthase n=1 Tax=Mucilaginibacter gossypii TaxID=551996 RepID=UPI000DCBCFE0|nr:MULTISPECIES: phosphoenolpyruvate synthase [Mucilaginibacter]QTE38948.1 phosphoenolpyruvate synthase [Mucilaginibacter gossypii]RAV53550.1 phosphoenolpyruvate synthase [Mucilaginibacter rubeus]